MDCSVLMLSLFGGYGCLVWWFGLICCGLLVDVFSLMVSWARLVGMLDCCGFCFVGFL